MSLLELSIVTPCFNEEGNVRRCSEEVRKVMESHFPDANYEHIFSDNASTDRTVDVLKQIALEDARVKVIVNSRNVGPFRNIGNALKHVRGNYVVPMLPADLQDPPSVIPEFFEKMKEQIDVVYGIRANRTENLILKFARKLYYKIVKFTGGFAPPAHAGEFLLARREIVDSINKVGGSYPYIRGLIAQTQPRFDVVEYKWAIRVVGKSRNSFSDLLDQALNGLVSTARTPIRISLFLGILGSLVGMSLGIIDLILFLSGLAAAVQGIPTLIVATFLFGGFQLFFLGLIGEYVLSIHSEVRPEPPMFEKELINFN